MKYYPDISHYHPVTDWSKVKETCPFIITKATQGTSYIDPTLGRFIAECENRKIPYWLYAYLNKGDELAQAQYLVRVVRQRTKSKYFMGYILDVEAGNSASGVQEALDWLNEQGKKTMIYTMYSQYSKYKAVIAGRGSNCAWWEARYGKNNGQDTSGQYPCHNGVDLHQYTSRGTVPGIGNNIDLNRVVNKSVTWFTDGKTAATPEIDTVLALTYRTMLGEFGTGEQRKNALEGKYKEIQALINHIASTSTKTLAKEVIAGKYGSGKMRKVVLGNRYKAVQRKVNKLL